MNVENNLVNQKEMEYMVTAILHKMGIPANLRGYHYLREAIIFSVGNDDIIGSVTKILYPEISKRHRTSTPSVERAIRHAICVAWERGAGAVFSERYDYYSEDKPSNSEFIAHIADEIYLNLKYSNCTV